VVDHDLTATLIALADRQSPDALPPDHDPHRVAEAVLDELLSRAALLDRSPLAAHVQFEFTTADDTLGYVVVTGPRDGGQTDAVKEGWVPDPDVRIRQDLLEAVRSLYGPAGVPSDLTREVVVGTGPGPTSPDADDPATVHWQAARLTSGWLVRAFGPGHHDLSSLALRFGSDKWGGHHYTPNYERHFTPYRDRPVRVLEIGIGGYEAADLGGASLRMWKHFFPRGSVLGLDIADKSDHDEPRIRTVVGDQSNVDFLTTLNARHGPFDIVIDDGSHLSPHVITTFTTLFPLLRPDGLYVVEDLETSYWPGWKGSTDPADPSTSVGFLKTLVDAVNHQGPAAQEVGRDITGAHFYHNMAILEKGANREQPAPAWLRERPPV
jgi:demethylmacrocin O-methyltransferase